MRPNVIRLFILVVLLTTVGCRDPLSLRRKCVLDGNKLYDRGKFHEASLLYRRALQFDAKYADAYYRLGLTYLKMDAYPSAASAFRRSVQLDEANDDACVKLGDLYIRAGVRQWNNYARSQVIDGLRPLVDRLLRKNPKSFDGLRFAGYLKRLEGDRKTAIEKFRAANEVQPWDAETVLALVESLIFEGRTAEAEKLGRELMERNRQFTPVYALLYVFYIEAGRLDNAEEISLLRMQNIPRDGGARIQLALFYYMRNRQDDMRRILESMHSDKLPDEYHLTGEFYMRIGDLDRAAKAYREGAGLDPNQRAAYEQLAIEALAAGGRVREALDAAQRLYRAYPGNTEAAALHFVLHAELHPKEIDGAIAKLEDFALKAPSDPALHYYLGRLYRRRGDRESLDRAIAHLEMSAGLRPDFTAARLALAQAHLARHSDESAIQIADDVLRSEPGNLEARLIRAHALTNLHQLVEARKELAAALRMHDKSNETRFQLARLDFSEKRYDDALVGFQALAQTGDSRGLAGMAETLAAESRIEEGIRLLERECSGDNAPDQCRLALASLKFRNGDVTEARQLLERLVRKNPSSAELHLQLAEVRLRSGDIAAALLSFRTARELNPMDAHAAFGLARLLETTGQKQEAAAAYEETLKIDPNYVPALNNLAYLDANLGVNLDRALTLAQRAVENLPGEPTCIDTLALVHLKRGLIDQAIGMFRGLVDGNPANPSFHLHLAMALFAARQRNDSRAELQLAMSRNLPADDLMQSKALAAQLQ